MKTMRRSLRTWIFVWLCLLAWPSQAQTPVALPDKFPLPENPVALVHAARPGVYFDAIGRQAGLLGLEDGSFEAWGFPIKLFHDAQFTISVEGQDQPVPFSRIVQRVISRPEATTLIGSNQLFTLRATYFSPIDETASIILLDVDTARPLTITVSFTPDLKPMWPAGLGGQSSGWRDDLKAFVISESRRQYNAFFGSPAATKGIATPAHQLAAGALRFELKVDPQQARRSYYPLIIASGIKGRPPVLETYQRLSSSVTEQYQKTYAHYRRLREERLSVETSDPKFNLAFEWAKAALDKGMIDNPELGLGLVAGWGAAGAGARPGFGWFFGGDAAINSFALTGYGEFESIAAALKFLAKFQRADGKIPHEIAQSAGMIKWFEEYPYAYYHADTTPLFIAAAYHAFRQSGDKEFIAALWEPLKRAYQFCRANDTDGDGILENSKAGLGASELGTLLNDLHQDIYLAASHLEASLAMRDLSRLQGDTELQRVAEEAAQQATKALATRYFDPATNRYAYALTKSGQRNPELTAWSAVPLFFGQCDPTTTLATLEALASHQLSTDWGVRMLSQSSPAYDPIAYNNGGVWPFLTGFVATGEYKYGNHFSGFQHLQQLSQLTFIQAQGYHPEILSGDFYQPLDESVPHQLFSTGMIVTTLLKGLLGLSPDAPNRELRIAPQFPAQWESVKLRNYRLGASRLNLEFQRPTQSNWRLNLSKTDDQPLRLLFAPQLPPFSKVRRVTLDGKSLPFTTKTSSNGLLCQFELLLRNNALVEITFDAGVELNFVTPEPATGDRTQNLKVLSARFSDPKTLAVSLEALPTNQNQVYLRSQIPVNKIEGARLLKESSGWKVFELATSQATTEKMTEKTTEKINSYQRHQLVIQVK